MLPIQDFATNTLAEILRRQPDSSARTSFAWQAAVGPVLARATTVTLRDGVLTVRATDPRWGHEIMRSHQMVLSRLRHLLGPESVTHIKVER
jgi:predicted nucleic acid-binding Zn ribbon protein